MNTVSDETACWSLIDLVQQNPKPNMKNRLLKAMEAQAKRQPEKNDAYQAVLKKLDQAKIEHEKQLAAEKQKKVEKEKEKEISELKQKVKLLEDSNMVLAERLKSAESQITELFRLIQVSCGLSISVTCFNRKTRQAQRARYLHADQPENIELLPRTN